MMRTLPIFAVLFRLCTVGSAEYCNGIQQGDIMVTAFNMVNPDQVLLVLLENVAEGATFYMTDRPWDGTAFLDVDNDGSLKWTVDASGLPQNAELCHACTLDGSVQDRFEPVSTGNKNHTFSLASDGDTIILYCMTEPEGNNGTSSVRHISAITNTGGWVTNSTGNEGQSVLPADLANDTVTTLGGYPNAEYDGLLVGTASAVRAGLSDAQSWDLHDEWIPDIQTRASFKIVDDPDSGDFVYSYFGKKLIVFASTIACWLPLVFA